MASTTIQILLTKKTLNLNNYLWGMAGYLGKTTFNIFFDTMYKYNVKAKKKVEHFLEKNRGYT
jgi:hypothetical protein